MCVKLCNIFELVWYTYLNDAEFKANDQTIAQCSGSSSDRLNENHYAFMKKTLKMLVGKD